MEVITKTILKPLVTEPNGHKPLVILDKFENKFEFSGISVPDNVYETYLPVIKWFEAYKRIPNPETTIIFRMEYVCRDSSSMLIRIFEILQDIYNGGNHVLVKWYYQVDDEDIRSEGRELANSFNLPFELINFKH